jgi:hypothetical protein
MSPAMQRTAVPLKLDEQNHWGLAAVLLRHWLSLAKSRE